MSDKPYPTELMLAFEADHPGAIEYRYGLRSDRYLADYSIAFEYWQELADLKALNAELVEALNTLVLVVGLTAFKHEGQRQVLQEAVEEARAALAKAKEQS